jgi:hypothetical protein
MNKMIVFKKSQNVPKVIPSKLQVSTPMDHTEDPNPFVQKKEQTKPALQPLPPHSTQIKNLINVFEKVRLYIKLLKFYVRVTRTTNKNKNPIVKQQGLR